MSHAELHGKLTIGYDRSDTGVDQSSDSLDREGLGLTPYMIGNRC